MRKQGEGAYARPYRISARGSNVTPTCARLLRRGGFAHNEGARGTNVTPVRAAALYYRVRAPCAVLPYSTQHWRARAYSISTRAAVL